MTILALSFSVLACAYLSLGSMDMHSHMDGMSIDHVSHANSLILAMIPTIILLLIALCAMWFISFFETPLTSPTFKYFLVESAPPPTRGSSRYFFNPRAPPFR